MGLSNLIQCAIMLIIILSLFGCLNVYESSYSLTPAAYTDPFAYCAAVGTVDVPDARYTGSLVPEAIARGLRNVFNTPDTSLDVFMKDTFWRCMNGKVYACTVGANLPCESKANTSRVPTRAEKDFCQQNPNADFIPMSVTGHETVYEWRCKSGIPEIVREFTQPDARGFLSNIWYEINPN